MRDTDRPSPMQFHLPPREIIIISPEEDKTTSCTNSSAMPPCDASAPTPAHENLSSKNYPSVPCISRKVEPKRFTFDGVGSPVASPSLEDQQEQEDNNQNNNNNNNDNNDDDNDDAHDTTSDDVDHDEARDVVPEILFSLQSPREECSKRYVRRPSPERPMRQQPSKQQQPSYNRVNPMRPPSPERPRRMRAKTTNKQQQRNQQQQQQQQRETQLRRPSPERPRRLQTKTESKKNVPPLKSCDWRNVVRTEREKSSGKKERTLPEIQTKIAPIVLTDLPVDLRGNPGSGREEEEGGEGEEQGSVDQVLSELTLDVEELSKEFLTLEKKQNVEKSTTVAIISLFDDVMEAPSDEIEKRKPQKHAETPLDEIIGCPDLDDFLPCC